VETVFIDHSLPNGTMMHNGQRVDCAKITRTAMLTVEGEKDDITGRGQTRAAHVLCTGLSDDMKAHYEQPNVGHYGVFNGSRWRAEIAPRVMDFIRSHRTDLPGKAAKPAPAKKAPAAATPRKKPAATKTVPTSLESILLVKPDGAADDLKAISGVGPKLESALNEAGIFHFWQISGLTADQIEALDSKLDFRGRIERDNWIDQARQLSEAVG
jgi:poly(3-hydroxybutyrate) depolymerase